MTIIQMNYEQSSMGLRQQTTLLLIFFKKNLNCKKKLKIEIGASNMLFIFPILRSLLLLLKKEEFEYIKQNAK